MLRLFLTSREQKKKIKNAQSRNRTSDTRIFSPLLYRLSYGTIMAVWTGLEPATSAVTGRHSNQLNYQTILVAGEGFEPTTFGL